MPEPEVLDVEETAALLRVAPEVVVEEAASGRLPGRRIGGRWRFGRAQLLAWLGGGTRPPAPPADAQRPDPQQLLETAESGPPTPGEAAARDDTDALGEG